MSPARLSHYLGPAGGDKNMALRLYIWNARLCEEFYIPIQFTEVAVRNAVSRALSDTFGQDWFQNNVFIRLLPDKHKGELSSTIRRERGKMGRNFSVNDVIAGMTFGFWGHLLSHQYGHQFWSAGLSIYFPFLPIGHQLIHVYKRVDDLRDFRNDVFHHQPIFDKHPKRKYNQIRELLSWVCKDTVWLMGELCNPDLVIQRRPRF